MFALGGCINTADKDSDEEIQPIGVVNSDNTIDEVIEIKVNPMECFSGKTRQEIYDIRKKYVAESIFKSDNYEPSDKVFGGIQDGKPWRSIFTEFCCYSYSKQTETKGYSEESRFIDNPALLVAVKSGWYYYIDKFEKGDTEHSKCFSSMSYFMPDKITYCKNKRLITVYYDYIHNFRMPPVSLYLTTINAQDFGYNYGKMVKNGDLIFFQPKDNISTRVYEFQDFIHTGNSCGVPGGCNNASPYIRGYDFYPTISDTARRPVNIDIKLWKQKPKSDEDEADMNYRIVFKYNVPMYRVFAEDIKNRKKFGIENVPH